MKASFVLIFLTVFMIFTAMSVKEAEAFCGGCGCNIFNCNCDWRPDQCKRDVQDVPTNNSENSTQKRTTFEEISTITKLF